MTGAGSFSALHSRFSSRQVVSENDIARARPSSVRVWDMANKKDLFKFMGHSGPVYTVVVTLDEFMAISAGADRSVPLFGCWSLCPFWRQC